MSSIGRLASSWRSSLAAKFIILVACVTSLVLGLAAWYSYYSYREVYIDHLRSKVDLLAGFVATISPDRIFSYDFSALHTYVRGLSHTKDLTYAVVIGADGEAMTAYMNKENPIIANAIQTLGSSDIRAVVKYIDSQPDTIAVASPILFDEQQVGTVRLGATRSFVDAELWRILLWNVIGSMLVVLLLSIGIYWVFRENILRPTRTLIEGARRVADGNLRQPIPPTSPDELGQLAGSFNEMMTSLDRSNAERTQALEGVRDLNRTLEIRVEERTQAIEAVNRKLERLALYDPLTNLPNRTLIQDRLALTLKAAERAQAPFAVMLMDLDHFKEVNDTFGHHSGDQLLTAVGACLAASLRGADTIGRLGGDEFAIILPNTDKDGAVYVAGRLFKALEQPVQLSNVSLMVGASLGIAIYPEHGVDEGTLFKHADVAMYEAKQGRLGYSIYNKNIDIHSPRRIELMNELRVAVENGQMQLYYQPIMDIASGTIRGVEALARWPHPEKGFVSPDQFIPMIEQTGLIRPFTAWVINEALCQWAAWRAQGVDLVVSVNLSMRNLQDKEFPKQLDALLQKWSVPPHVLMLEVTESAMMGDPEHALQTLNYFRNLGAGVGIDDFGTGYSSLSYLKRMPVNELKIDRSFVKDMCHDKDDAVIVRSTIDLAHNLGLIVVAEGVEDEATLSLLKDLNCDMAQGYYFSRPVPAEQIALLKVPAVLEAVSR